jgi:hypothetical protein
LVKANAALENEKMKLKVAKATQTKVEKKKEQGFVSKELKAKLDDQVVVVQGVKRLPRSDGNSR